MLFVVCLNYYYFKSYINASFHYEVQLDFSTLRPFIVMIVFVDNF